MTASRSREPMMTLEFSWLPQANQTWLLSHLNVNQPPSFLQIWATPPLFKGSWRSSLLPSKGQSLPAPLCSSLHDDRASDYWLRAFWFCITDSRKRPSSMARRPLGSRRRKPNSSRITRKSGISRMPWVCSQKRQNFSFTRKFMLIQKCRRKW